VCRYSKDAHRAYLQSTDARTQSFKQLTKQDGVSARTIEKRMRKLIRLQVGMYIMLNLVDTNLESYLVSTLGNL
jgi:hypothetical protein